jgi:hypothetical protein
LPRLIVHTTIDFARIEGMGADARSDQWHEMANHGGLVDADAGTTEEMKAIESVGYGDRKILAREIDVSLSLGSRGIVDDDVIDEFTRERRRFA